MRVAVNDDENLATRGYEYLMSLPFPVVPGNTLLFNPSRILRQSRGHHHAESEPRRRRGAFGCGVVAGSTWGELFVNFLSFFWRRKPLKFKIFDTYK